MAGRLRGSYKFANEEDDVSVVSSYIMLALGFESGDVASCTEISGSQQSHRFACLGRTQRNSWCRQDTFIQYG